MTLYVNIPGLYTSVQDTGRYGHLNMGVPSSGALDFKSHILANKLLGNESNAATIEMNYTGASFTVKKPTYISAVGADMHLKVNKESMPLGTPIAVSPGDEISFDKAIYGSRSYLGISGGFISEKYLDSRATHENLGFGKRLSTGDLIKSGPVRRPNLHVKLKVAETDTEIRIIPGQQFDYFSDAEIDRFLNNAYSVSTKSDRMGFRLEGARIYSGHGYDILSEPTLLGSIQIPADGKPIVLLNERQTIGGYPKVATVIKADIPKLVQKHPGETFSFKFVELEEARQLYKELKHNLESDYYLKEYSQARRVTSSRISGLLGGD